MKEKRMSEEKPTRIISKELIIIGGGPAGLRAGEEAKKNGLDYIILEAGQTAQAWRDIRPEMKLLSPCHPQRDWTSISPNFPIWKLQVDRPYCTAASFIHYLDSYLDYMNLDLETNKKVLSVSHDGEYYQVSAEGYSYIAPVIVVATGIFSNPFFPPVPGIENNPIITHTHYFMAPDEYDKQRVLIVGAGNSAAETAIELSGKSMVYMVTRGDLKYFSDTKKLYDIRGISESYLKELISMEIIRYKPHQEINRIENNVVYFRDWKLEVDKVIFGTGYRPHTEVLSSFHLRFNKKNYPENSYSGESLQMPNLFFAGPLAYHSAASIVIHGFVKRIPKTIERIVEILKNKSLKPQIS
jgi:putative flavoprotein involved in K+ transport